MWSKLFFTIKWISITAFMAVMFFFFFCLYVIHFDAPTSTVLYAKDKTLLSAVIAADGQWRFPARDSVPEKFERCLLAFEDHHFYEHNGVYLPSMLRAFKQNIKAGKVVSGGSTITMQVIRLGRKNPERSLHEKWQEVIRAMRLELTHSKEEILALYAANAPYGGNVVGLDAAAWRYFGRRPEDLSWAEAATLAVLPNAPALIFPGKNQDKLKQKRNAVLSRLRDEKVIDQETFELSCAEEVPQKPFPLPQSAQHMLQYLTSQHGSGKRYNTTVDAAIQENVRSIVGRHQQMLDANLVHNIAVLVVEVKSGNVLAYVGNTEDAQNRHGNQVDVIQARRSTGSILKPILYAASMQDGRCLPHALVADVPVQFDGFAPQNYSETFDGAVPASRALSRSLNIPAVLMLKDYGYQRFHYLLKQLQFKHIDQPADHYGLSLILGGAEASLWDITHTYAGMSRIVSEYNEHRDQSVWDACTRRHCLVDEQTPEWANVPLQAGAVWTTFSSLLEVNRPESELGWEEYSSSSPIAWKTGTSFGNRDAWAVGTTPEFVVGVWVGNASGEGRPELTGVSAAAPIMFDVFHGLPNTGWFSVPYDNLVRVEVCAESGMLKNPLCPNIDSVFVPINGTQTLPCSYHSTAFLDESFSFQVNLDCYPQEKIRQVSWFVLPPLQGYYYSRKHPEYRALPPFLAGCMGSDVHPIGLIYPKSDAQIFLPRNIGGKQERTVLEATHQDPNATLYWHLDNTFLGETKGIHQTEVLPEPGTHVLTIVDESGNSLVKKIEVVGR